ncbi:hypothetical protein [Devosia sp. RR2S18]|uniref:hypothetical protein n=1 Tax=Devosia rhizosphaerae TaxID=3049774 RepID=UPI002540F42D|nr:hypothetical protein [Devosia sp. RR2S18]WIJ26978.1 hypothetical protein QOV41_09625 [Devosia sp. RR2S18]
MPGRTRTVLGFFRQEEDLRGVLAELNPHQHGEWVIIRETNDPSFTSLTERLPLSAAEEFRHLVGDGSVVLAIYTKSAEQDRRAGEAMFNHHPETVCIHDLIKPEIVLSAAGKSQLFDPAQG